MIIANATGCTSIWGASAPSMPYTTNKKGHGPAWANSLFEDNAEYGFGIHLAMKHRREKLAEIVRELSTSGNEEVNEACAKWLEVKDDGKASVEASENLLTILTKIKEGCGGSDCGYVSLIDEVLAKKELLTKKTTWIFGGDGWAYDIGFGGLDHVLASGENVNIVVFDTEVYSNTGGQASKSTPTGAIAQFAASGKAQRKKDLAAIAMSYGYVYVAQIAMGADYNQTIKALNEAESYDGPSLVIAYSPCINHGIRKGLGNSMAESKAAVASGYWNNFRYDPRLADEGKNPFVLDSKEPTESYIDFIKNETRYSALSISFPERATKLFDIAAKDAKAKYAALKERAEQ